MAKSPCLQIGQTEKAERRRTLKDRGRRDSMKASSCFRLRAPLIRAMTRAIFLLGESDLHKTVLMSGLLRTLNSGIGRAAVELEKSFY